MVDPVFVDRSGRRRRLFTGLGAGMGVLLVLGASLLIAGLLGSSPVPLPGLPQSGQGAQHRDGAGSGGIAPAPSRTSAVPRPTPTGAPPAVPAGSTTGGPAAGSPPASEPHDSRRTSHPANAKPSRTK
ncbi:hypothetical protein Daura_02115 [Dactylosporangium aurantiacum]|uniref:Uncharacterized protein n=1 Tax=Dactylosporangium aurantiacum TaxID=35754 RepID=A0A9Q9IKL6_9ACTN|nr:hypothetical protein [Dactylosporangium aurantiacum]MDG6100840.1 hypothetical protein [Dactylosporangium aurantiacum]UWZ55099.1 hypothetical protein Daura_02115 [Dactylosporangium aurantiacum]